MVGGGVNGASIAMHLARIGAGRVLLLEKGHLASGASGRSGAGAASDHRAPRENRDRLCARGGAPTLERKAPLTMQEEEGAVRIAQASGIVERINGGQGWMATRVYRTIIAGREGIQIDAIWDEPVDSAGPWTLLQCTGTLRVESSARWRDVTRLVIWVDTQEDSVAGYAVISELEDDPQPAIDNTQSLTDIIRAYSTLTGRLLYVGPSALSPPRAILCESGTFYQD